MTHKHTHTRTVGCHMEQGNRLGIAGITSNPLPGVIPPGNIILLVFSSQHEFDNIIIYRRWILGF